MSSAKRRLKLRGSRRDAIIGGLLIPVILAVGIAIAWLSGQGILPYDPQLTIFLTVGTLIVVLCFAAASLTSTSALGRQPKITYADSINRVIRDESGKEHLASGTHDMTVREALLLDWPFKGKDHKSEWVVQDEAGAVVNDRLLVDTEGIFIIRFMD